MTEYLLVTFIVHYKKHFMTDIFMTGATWVPLFALLLFVLTLYYYFNVRKATKKLQAPATLQTPGIQTLQMAKQEFDDFPELIDRPIDNTGEQMELYIDTEKDPLEFEIIENEDSRLLKEVETVVAKIQEVVSKSPNADPKQVFSQIKSIVSQYRIFENTEYYEAINNFILITVERDCTIHWNKEDMQALWN